MSQAPVMLDRAMVTWLGAWAGARGLSARLKTLARLRPGHLKPVIALLRGLTDPIVGLNMGQTAEVLAHRFRISRTAMDTFATTSHERLAAAQAAGYLDEIVPLYDGRGTLYATDDGLRAETTTARLATLKPAFDKPHGLVTAGNSAQISDGAAWLLLASAEAVERHELPVLGRVVDCQWAGLDPAQMGLGPVYAMAPLLQRQGLDSTDIDCWEINEAFAAQVLACCAAWTDAAFCREQLGRDAPFAAIDPDRLNMDGGGISLGHPVGASGARIVLHLLRVLERERGRYGMASLCIGGGQGGAMLLERVTGVSA
jgi:acetyl-CoA C-acetyltransferase